MSLVIDPRLVLVLSGCHSRLQVMSWLLLFVKVLSVVPEIVAFLW